MPRNIVPTDELPSVAPQPEPPPPAMPAAPMPEPQSESNVVSRGFSVQVGDLGTLEGPVAGTLDDANGGLGAAAWQGSDRATIIAMLQAVPASTPSAVHRQLMRQVLLTAAPAPLGRANVSFNWLRLSKLLDGGYIEDAADLATRIQAPMNPDILRLQADALLYAGRDADVCGDITSARRFDSAEPFWVELRAYCYAVNGDSGPLELTRAVIMEQGIADPAFMILLDGMASGMPVAPEVLRFPDSIHIMMLAKLGLPMTSEIATNLGLAAGSVAIRSQATPPALRLAAAERAFRAGTLSPLQLAAVLDLSTFMPEELNGAPALARAEPLMRALARLKMALAVAPDEALRAELVHTAFEIGEQQNLLAQVAALFANDAGGIMPMADWANWSDLMMRGLLLAGQPDAAQRWFDILDRNAPGMAATVDQLELALALAAPNPRRATAAGRLLNELSRQVYAPPVPAPLSEPLSPDLFAPGVTALPAPVELPKPLPETINRAGLDLGLFDAAGMVLPPEAQAAVQPVVPQATAGRRPAPALLARIDSAALSGARAELALSVATAIGREGVRDLAPDAAVRMVRALRTGGIEEAARALAAETLLLRPRAGATGL